MGDSENKEMVGKAAENLQSLGDAARDTGQQARQAGVEALGHAQDVAREAKSRAASALGALGEQASSVAEGHKADLAERLETVAKAVHKSGEQLEDQSDWVAKLVEQGADELTSLAGTLRSNDLQSLLGNLGGLARRQPALFVGASIAVGFALTRVGLLAASNPTQTGSETKSQFTAAMSSAAPMSPPPPRTAPTPPSVNPEPWPAGVKEVDREQL